MKKKIVYISGAEVFDVNDVRAAFDEVRNALGLGSDTILFGVPVDAEESVDNAVDVAQVVATDVAMTPVLETESDNNVVLDASDDDTEETSAVEHEIDVESDAPVVPILSVLASNEDDATCAMDTESAKDISESAVPDNQAANAIDPDLPEPDIADMINDDMPMESGEKTLEELLETMTPLREDAAVAPVKKKAKKAETVPEPVDEIDATLENLASEFAENQDKVGDSKKGLERGKIGKLKNILPFKKIKRDDSGLMGDLFGWAGIAANDDDFTIPGFFKQKM